jgi:hypothetical protein
MSDIFGQAFMLTKKDTKAQFSSVWLLYLLYEVILGGKLDSSFIQVIDLRRITFYAWSSGLKRWKRRRLFLYVGFNRSQWNGTRRSHSHLWMLSKKFFSHLWPAFPLSAWTYACCYFSEQVVMQIPCRKENSPDIGYPILGRRAVRGFNYSCSC